MSRPTLVTLLRHGEVEGRAHVFRGSSDEPLSAEGEAQMRAALARLPGPPITCIASSPLQRCRKFAEAYAAECDVPLDIVAELREKHFGRWEGLSCDEAAADDPAAFARFSLRDDAAAAPEGETLGAFRQRVLAAWQDWLGDADGGHRLLISHAGVMRVLLQDALGLPSTHIYRIALPVAAHCQLSWLAGEPPVLLNLNGHGDFEWL